MAVVPEHLQDGLGTEATGRAASSARIEFLSWMHTRVDEVGPVQSFVTRDAGTRVAVAALARSERAVVTTFTVDELEGPA
jgi:hypothetical protein